MDYYYDLLKGWLFTKSNQPHSTTRYAIGGLRYRSERLLREISQMEIGDSIETNGYILTREENMK